MNYHPLLFSFTSILTATGFRLVNLVAEDNAIEDTMYYLHRALNSGRIDLERFLRVSQAFPFLIFKVSCFILLHLSAYLERRGFQTHDFLE